MTDERQIETPEETNRPKPLIPGGYILLSRKLLENEIMNKPPLYLKVWIWLLLKARFSKNRGQVETSIPELQEAMSYYKGSCKIIPSYKQIRSIIDYFKNTPVESVGGTTEGNRKGTGRETGKATGRGNMIVTRKGTHGLLISICNYNKYQNPQNYEGQKEGQAEGQLEGNRKGTGREPEGTNAIPETLENTGVAGSLKNVIKKECKNDNISIIVMPPEEVKFHEVLKSIPNYPYNEVTDHQMYLNLSNDFPAVDLVEVAKSWKTYLLDKPLKQKSNPRSQLRNQCKLHLKWGKCLKQQTVTRKKVYR